MTKKSIYPLLFYGLALLHQGHAQTGIRATGKVITTDGRAIPNATIDVANVQSGKHVTFLSGEDGMFLLNDLSEQEMYHIFVHHVGYERDSIMNFTVKSNRTNSILIRLKSGETALDEVVVIGYGSVQKKDLTGAISTVDGKDIAVRKTTQLSQALQGQSRE